MPNTTLNSQVFKVHSKESFDALALRIFNFQYQKTEIYRKYCELIHVTPEKVKTSIDIPFLPIHFFKTHQIITKDKKAELLFKSSGTGNSQERSSHYIADKSIYQRSLLEGFENVFGSSSQYIFYSILPGYNENPGSSLIYMIEELSTKSLDKKLYKFENKNDLIKSLIESNRKKQRSILFGVSFALMDLVQNQKLKLSYTTVVETGGMKGKRKEITREELHDFIHHGLSPAHIVSEYGMTELLSQAYAFDDIKFKCPPWMRVFVRDIHDPFSIKTSGTGALNIIDLANIYSCAFIATDDIGHLDANESFSILGRFDHSDIRGCNLMYEENLT